MSENIGTCTFVGAIQMICPLCQKELVPKRAYATLSGIYDPHDFHCTTLVNASIQGAKWLHYDRSTSLYSGALYCAVVPPFRIVWYPDKDLIKVDKFATNEIIYRQEECGIDYDTYVKTCLRFQALRLYI